MECTRSLVKAYYNIPVANNNLLDIQICRNLLNLVPTEDIRISKYN